MRERSGDEDNEREERHGPAEDPTGGTIGNTDERSSENRRDGLERDRQRARDPDEVVRRDRN